MSAIQDGDTRAFEELFARHQTTAYEIAISMVRNAHMAEEIVQETFLSIWRGRLTYRRRAESSVAGWVRGIARNRAIDLIRYGAVRRRPPAQGTGAVEVPDLSSEHPFDDVLEQDELFAWRDRLRGSLAGMPAAQAQVLLLSFIRELTHTEIAAKLALPEGTVKGRIRLARARMLADLTEEASELAVDDVHEDRDDLLGLPSNG